jgi:hypothetical protein
MLPPQKKQNRWCKSLVVTILNSTHFYKFKTTITLGIRVYVPLGIGPVRQFQILRAGQGEFMLSAAVVE